MIYLHVIASNESGIRFYKRNGYIVVKLIKRYYEIEKKEYDAYLFVKILDHSKEKISLEEEGGEIVKLKYEETESSDANPKMR